MLEEMIFYSGQGMKNFFKKKDLPPTIYFHHRYLEENVEHISTPNILAKAGKKILYLQTYSLKELLTHFFRMEKNEGVHRIHAFHFYMRELMADLILKENVLVILSTGSKRAVTGRP